MGFCLWRFFKVRLAWIALAALPAVVLAFALPAILWRPSRRAPPDWRR